MKLFLVFINMFKTNFVLIIRNINKLKFAKLPKLITITIIIKMMHKFSLHGYIPNR